MRSTLRFYVGVLEMRQRRNAMADAQRRHAMTRKRETTVGRDQMARAAVQAARDESDRVVLANG